MSSEMDVAEPNGIHSHLLHVFAAEEIVEECSKRDKHFNDRCRK